MAFACRICKEKFNVSRLLTERKAVSEGYSVVATQCGHLFHSKCLEGALTNQKLLHMRHGTGPLRRFCPVARCNADIKSEESVIPISLQSEERNSIEEDGDSKDDSQDVEAKLVKRIQALVSEKEKLLEGLQRSDMEAELLRAVLEEIKSDLAEIQGFLKDDRLLRKGDLIFWVTKEGTYAPGKVLEIRKKPGETHHYAVVKLERKTVVSGIGPNVSTRDTLILPVSELVTYKSFFCDFFDKFQAKFESLMIDLSFDIQEIASPAGPQSTDRSAAYYRSTRKISRSSSKPNIEFDGLDSSVSVEYIPIATRRHSQPLPETQTPYGSNKPLKNTNISRSRTIHYGEGNRPRRLEKCRSKSWANPQTSLLMDSPNESLELEMELGRLENFDEDTTTTSRFQDLESEGDGPKEFINVGEDVIWYDSYSEYEQIGTVAAVCDFSPCAIVRFEEHPFVKHKFQYRTVPLDELFPYDLASAEDKLRIAGIYGKMIEFVDDRQHIFSCPNDESTSASDSEDANHQIMHSNGEANEADC